MNVTERNTGGTKDDRRGLAVLFTNTSRNGKKRGKKKETMKLVGGDDYEDFRRLMIVHEYITDM